MSNKDVNIAEVSYSPDGKKGERLKICGIHICDGKESERKAHEVNAALVPIIQAAKYDMWKKINDAFEEHETSTEGESMTPSQIGALLRAIAPPADEEEISDSEEKPVPIGKCKKCGANAYTNEGFCGACGSR